MQRIREGDAAIGRLIDTMHSLGEERLINDDPVVAWIDDWETLRPLWETYADELSRGGSPQMVVPTVDDVPITVRMSEVSTCTVARQLAEGPEAAAIREARDIAGGGSRTPRNRTLIDAPQEAEGRGRSHGVDVARVFVATLKRGLGRAGLGTCQ